MATAAKIIGYGLEEVSPPDLSDLAERVRLSPTAIKGFLRMMEKWKIKDEDARQLLGGLSASSYYALKKSPKRTL